MTKQTSDHVSSIAGKYMGRSRPLGIDAEFWSDIQSMAASCLAQDEHAGKRPIHEWDEKDKANA
jgi:hypothetical protein